MKQLDEMADEELIGMTTEDMMKFVLDNPPEKVRENLEEWHERFYSLGPSHYERLANDLTYCLEVLADIHEELSRKHRLRREVLDRKRKLIDEELKQVEEEMAELQNFGKLALQRVKEDRLRRMS
jgi:hypothetical protein